MPRRSLWGLIVLMAVVNTSLVLTAIGFDIPIFSFVLNYRLALAFEVGFGLWALLTFWGRKPLNPNDNGTD